MVKTEISPRNGGSVHSTRNKDFTHTNKSKQSQGKIVDAFEQMSMSERSEQPHTIGKNYFNKKGGNRANRSVANIHASANKVQMGINPKELDNFLADLNDHAYG